MNREQMLGEYDVKKLLIKLSIPAMVGMFVNALYNFVDTLFVAHGVGEVAIAGLGFAFPVQMIMTAVGLMIGIGSASVFSRAYGRRDREKMSHAVNTGLRIDFILAITFAAIGLLFIDKLLIFFGATTSNIDYARQYLSVILYGLVPMTMTMVLNNLTRAEGRATLAMAAMMVGTGLNIILDPIFIFDFGFGLGVTGAAIATVISQSISFVFIFMFSIGKKSSLMINLKEIFHIDWDTVKETVAVGMPTFLRNAIGAFLAIIIFRLIKAYAVEVDLYQSIYTVINRVINFIFMPGFGIVQGMVPIVGFNFGAKHYKRLKDVIVFATKIIITYFVMGFVFVQLFAKGIFVIFSSTQDRFFITYGAEAFKIISIGFLLVGFQIVVSAIFQAFGYPLRALIVTISRQVLFFIPLSFLFSSIWGVKGIWYAFFSADLLSGLISILLLLIEMKSINGMILNNINESSALS